ncbi:MAG TPA: hypothetical protein VJ623_10770 [Holophagaceae bacterium]|nr:hypothetical protein [Holophagaceae bacterium]
MRLLPNLCLALLALPLAAQERPEPGAIPALRSQLQGVFNSDPIGAWRSYCREGTPWAVVEVVSTFTEEERSENAFLESIALLKQGLREMWGRYGDAPSRTHEPAVAGDSPSRVYPLGPAIRP